MENQNFTIKKTKVECYKIRDEKRGSWADITIDVTGDHSGRISISSDYGNYANYWGACGSGFKQFLIDLNIDYAADKFRADRWFDLDCTLNGYKRRVIECRREGTLTTESAREIWDEIEELEDVSNESEFTATMWNQRKLMHFFDGCPDIDYGITPQFRRFWETVWPVFINELEEEMQWTEIGEENNFPEVKKEPYQIMARDYDKSVATITIKDMWDVKKVIENFVSWRPLFHK